jgi:hypothetical protein
MIVIKQTLNSEPIAVCARHDARDPANTLNSQLAASPVRGRQQNDDPDLATDRGTFTADHKGSVECNILGKTAPGLLSAIIPMKDDRQAQPVTDGRSLLRDRWGK